VSLDGVELLRLDVERFCRDVVDHPPAVRLRAVAGLRGMLDEVTTLALASAMASARDEGWGLRRIATFANVSHEQVRRMLAAIGGSEAAE
jgi:hypothetical protein